MINKIIFQIILFAFLLLNIEIAFAQQKVATQTVQVIGTGTIKNNDIEKVRIKTISNSLVTAVGIIMAQFVSSDDLAQNFKVLNKIVDDHTDQFIQGYKVLNELTLKNTYRIIVQATVSVDSVKKQLIKTGIIYDENTIYPKILFLIAEKSFDQESFHYWWSPAHIPSMVFAENAIAKIMKAKGYPVILHKSIFTDTNNNMDINKYNLDNKEAVYIGKLFQADIVIVGEACALRTLNTMEKEIKSFKATVSARALRVDNSAVITLTTKSFVTVNSDDILGETDSLKGAGKLAGQLFATTITDNWKKKAVTTNNIKIVVKGNNYFSNFVKFRKQLFEMPRVKKVYTKEIKSDQATVIVEFHGTTKELANALMFKTFDFLFGINIYEILQDSLRIMIVNK